MDCSLIDGDLVPFHFGTLEVEARARVEAHLVACSSCVAAFLALKRALDAEPEERPSDLARQRLRSAVQKEVTRPRLLPSRARWFLGGAAAAAAAIALAFGLATARPSPTPPYDVPATTDVDSARRVAGNLNYL